jgi:rod shape-determining protein MreC
VISHIESVKNFFENTYNQALKIESCKQEIEHLKAYKLLYIDIKKRLKLLQDECKIKSSFNFLVKIVEAISYVKLGDFTSLWLNLSPSNTILGALRGGFVAGIVKSVDNKSILYLNGNKKCSYGVSVGKVMAKGIARGSGDNRYVIVKYIHNYEKISFGDEVITNGLDNIFPYGLKVGKVVGVWQEGSYKVAKVKTYVNLKEPFYFEVVLKGEISNKDIN